MRPITITAGGRLEFPYFNGFLFYVANPLYLLLFIQVFRDGRAKHMDGLRWALLLAMAAELLLLCVHKTFGGWQFGPSA